MVGIDTKFHGTCTMRSGIARGIDCSKSKCLEMDQIIVFDKCPTGLNPICICLSGSSQGCIATATKSPRAISNRMVQVPWNLGSYRAMFLHVVHF